MTSLNFIFQDSDVGGGDHNSGTEQMSVSETESETSAKFKEQIEQPDQEDPPETKYELKDEGDVALSVSYKSKQ